MNNIDFREVIEGGYGIKDIPTYVEYKRKVGFSVAQAEIELLSPDNINSCSFWEYIEKNPELAKDAIGFGITKEGTREMVNQQNYGLACTLHVLSHILHYKDCEGMPILDIGAGYGMLKEFVEKNTKLAYHGVDVYPKVEGVLKVVEDGSTLPPEILAMKFGVIVSVNVFQHLSVKQRRHYYEQIENILHPTMGIFSITNCLSMNHPNIRGFVCKETQKQYMCHYGQYTEMQSYQEFVDDLSKHFIIISMAQRGMDNSFTFHCVKKQVDNPPTA